MTAINSHVIREIARDCAPQLDDFWVVYAGNNEVVGPFGAGTIFGRQAPGLAVVRASLLVKSTRLGQWLGSLRPRSAGPLEWQGMEMFLRNQVRSDAPGLQIVHENFARNLAAIIELGRRSGATVLLAKRPLPEDMIDRLSRGKVGGQITPRKATLDDVKDGIQDAPPAGRRAAALGGFGQHGFEISPLGICKTGVIYGVFQAQLKRRLKLAA